MFITNKKITELPASIWPDRLIVVHAENIDAYCGPFVAQLAHLTSLQAENEELNQEESDDEAYLEYNEDVEDNEDAEDNVDLN